MLLRVFDFRKLIDCAKTCYRGPHSKLLAEFNFNIFQYIYNPKVIWI
jgi:hypothetical protein